MTSIPAKYKITHDGDVMTASLFGEIDHHTAKSVRCAIDDAMYLHRPNKLDLDLGGVDFMDSSGLGLILGRMSKAEEIGCRVIITKASERVYKVLELAGIGRLITIEQDKPTNKSGTKNKEAEK